MESATNWHWRKNESCGIHYKINTLFLREHDINRFPSMYLRTDINPRRGNMKHKSVIFGVLGILIFVSLLGANLQEGEDLFQKALRMERSEGKIKEAITLYQRILDRFGDDRTLAAKAQLHIGYCFEKLGQKEAQKAYQSVIEKFADQAEQVAAARARLDEISSQPKPGSSTHHLYSWSDDDFLLEAQTLSPDGSKLLGIHISRDTGQNVVYKDIATGKFEFITNFDWKSEGHGWTYDPAWSQDGKQVVYNFGRWKDPKEEELRISNLKGETRTIYRCQTEDEDIYPISWFPGDRKILAIHIKNKKVIRLGFVPLQGGPFDPIYELSAPKGVNLRVNANGVIGPDLSPDGKYLVFHELRDGFKNLYVMDIESKNIKVLLDSRDNKKNPRWSPDGKHIAFMSDRSKPENIWAVSVGENGQAKGQPFLLRTGQDPSLLDWTAQGISYSEWIQMVDIYTMSVAPQTGKPTGKPQQLDFYPTGRNSFPIWSPDGKYLAFSSNLHGIPGDLYVVIFLISGGESRSFKVPNSNIGGTNPPSMLDLHWLPDGSGISYSASEKLDPSISSEEIVDRKLHVLNLDTDAWQSYQLKLENTSSSTAWRKDGQGFYYARNSWEPVALETGIVEHDLKTGEERYIYYPKIKEKQGFPSMRCSRDFTKIATHLFREKKLCVIDIHSGEKIQDFNFFGFPSPPAWSPDGKHLMISMWRQNQKLHVFSLLDGSKQAYDVDMEFMPNSGIVYLDWSPDGTKIAFASTYTKFDTHLLKNVIPEDTK